MSKTYIVDGNSLLFRSYFSTAYTGNLMTNANGVPTNAVFAFHNLMKKIKADLKEGDRLFVSFDTGKPSFRKKEFADYKAQRAPAPAELVAQMPIARDLLTAMDIHWKEEEGYEGDDLAGSMAAIAAKKGDEVTLFTSDKDFLQLLSLGPNVSVCFLKKGLTETLLYRADNLKELFGLNPDQITDFKGIAGDPSDNYKGIKGIGEKTAMKLLDQYGTLEGILEAAKKDPSSKTNQKIVAGEKDALFFKELARIETDLPLEKDYDASLYVPYHREKILAFYEKYQLRQFIQKIDQLPGLVSSSDQMTLFESSDAVEEKTREESVLKKRPLSLIHSLAEVKEPLKGLIYVSDGSNENLATLTGFLLGTEKGLYSLALEDAKKDGGFLSYLKSSEKKATYDLKGLDVLLSRNGLPFLSGVSFDLLIATYLINPDCGQKTEELLSSYGLTLDPEESLPAQVLSATLDLQDSVRKRIEENQETDLFEKTELPLSVVLAKMELEGFPMDVDTLKEIGTEYASTLKRLEEEIYGLAGGEFNINSTKQLEDLLFHKLSIPRAKGEKGTSVEVLNSHLEDHPIVGKILEYRTYKKLVSGYTEALPKHLFPDGKIHALYNQAMTATGRLSMSEPNLQNITIRNEVGKSIRKAFFYPDHEFLFLSIDYSQIELRVLASVGNIPALKEIFREGLDIHRATAARVFGKKIEDVTPEERRRAKAVNFGIVYGISAYGLSQRLGIPREEGSALISSFKKAFEGIDEFQKRCIAQAEENGYVTTILNRRRYLPDIRSQNHALRSFSERAAVNTTIQGSAADLIKAAMVQCQDLLEKGAYRTKIILQIHDELIFKVPKDELNAVLPKLKETMEHALPLDVPLLAEANWADNWYDAH